MGTLLIYVYEDFRAARRGRGDRARTTVNAVRRPISAHVAAQHPALCALSSRRSCMSTCTIPVAAFSWAARLPYPATQNPTMSSLIPDLYDRFAAPIEERYSERGARELVEQAGCKRACGGERSRLGGLG